MVIEQFRDSDPLPVRKRFLDCGRMLPDGVTYHASWIDSERARCFQIMEADAANAFAPWIEQWADIVDFDVIPVQTSADYWAAVAE